MVDIVCAPHWVNDTNVKQTSDENIDSAQRYRDNNLTNTNFAATPNVFILGWSAMCFTQTTTLITNKPVYMARVAPNGITTLSTLVLNWPNSIALNNIKGVLSCNIKIHKHLGPTWTLDKQAISLIAYLDSLLIVF